jgi:hypothetical protein
MSKADILIVILVVALFIFVWYIKHNFDATNKKNTEKLEEMSVNIQEIHNIFYEWDWETLEMIIE